MQWVVLRTATYNLTGFFWRNTQKVTALDGYLCQFRALQSVIVETHYVNDTEISTDNVAPNNTADKAIKLFPKVGENKIRWRPNEAGHKLAHEATRSNAAMQRNIRPISPFWCLNRCTNQWAYW